MSLGNKQVAEPTHEGGMTYRQWLIGMALSGMCGHPDFRTADDDVARNAIHQADIVIARLDLERLSK